MDHSEKSKPCCPYLGGIVRPALAVIIGFLFVTIYEIIVHGYYLTDLYQQTQNLWRSDAEMQQYAPISMLVQLLCVALTTLLVRMFNNKHCTILLAIIFGLLNGIHQFVMYAYMPIPLNLALAWLGTGFLESGILVLLISFILWGKSCKIGSCCKAKCGSDTASCDR